ncbi:hypothetical protein [Microcystis phage Mae-JY30]
MIKLRCAVCNKSVDGLELRYDPRERSRTLIARCHGDVDQMAVHDNDLQNWTAEERRQFEAIDRGEIEGLAFTTKRLGGER